MCVGIKHPLTLTLKLSLTLSLSLSPSHREECLYVCQCVKTPKDGMEWRKMRVCMSEREKEREREREREMRGECEKGILTFVKIPPV